MDPAYGSQELDFFELSPRDKVEDYVDPLEYIGVVKAFLEAGKMDEYFLPELEDVKKNLSKAYSSLYNEEIRDYEDTFHQMYVNVISLQNVKEEEEKIFLEDAVHSLDEFIDSYDADAPENKEQKYTTAVQKDLISLQDAKEQEVDGLISDTVSFLNEIVDTYDADAPENKARKYVSTVQNDLAAGKLNRYSLGQLQEVENNFKEAYSILSEEDKEIYLDNCTKIIIELTDLQNDRAEAGVASLIEDNFNDVKKNTRAGEGYTEIIVEEQEISAEEYAEILDLEYELDNSLESLITNLPIVPPDEVSSGNYPLRQRIFQSAGNKSYKAACVTSLPAKAYAKMPKDKVLIDYDALPGKAVNDKSGFENKPEEVSPASLETIAAIPKPRNKIASALAKAAIVAAAGIASLVGYNYLAPSVQEAADHSLQSYHGSPSVEVIAQAKNYGRYLESPSVKSVDTKSNQLEQPAVAPQAAPMATPQKRVIDLDEDIYAGLDLPQADIYDSLDSEVGFIQKGDTFVELWKDYSARGGILSFQNYLNSVKITNPHIANVNKIFPGQEVELPTY